MVGALKVFQIAFGRTGTKSIAAGLRQCGFSVLDMRREKLNRTRLIRLWAEGLTSELMEFASRYDVVEDHPWPFLYRELDALYPEARFLYSTRSPESWLNSIVKHTAMRGPLEGKRLVFGADTPVGHEAAYIDRFVSHREDVLRYFGDSSRFLEFDVTQPGAESLIGAFLGLTRFRLPQLNKSLPDTGVS